MKRPRGSICRVKLRHNPPDRNPGAGSEREFSKLPKRFDEMFRFSPALGSGQHKRQVITETKQSTIQTSIGSKQMFNGPQQCTSFGVEDIGFKLPWSGPNNSPIVLVQNLRTNFLKRPITDENIVHFRLSVATSVFGKIFDPQNPPEGAKLLTSVMCVSLLLVSC